MRIITSIIEAAAILCIVAAVALLAGPAWALIPLGLGLAAYAYRLRGSN